MELTVAGSWCALGIIARLSEWLCRKPERILKASHRATFRVALPPFVVTHSVSQHSRRELSAIRGLGCVRLPETLSPKPSLLGQWSALEAALGVILEVLGGSLFITSLPAIALGYSWDIKDRQGTVGTTMKGKSTAGHEQTCYTPHAPPSHPATNLPAVWIARCCFIRLDLE